LAGEVAASRSNVLWHLRHNTAILLLSIHALAVVIAWCAVLSISASASFEQGSMLIRQIMLITMLPISSASWGVR
jgi:glycosyltransferase 2 family protein